MKSFRMRRLAVVLAGLGSLCAGPVVRADSASLDGVLKLIPGDAWGFALIPSLEGLNNSINLIQKEVTGQAMMDLLQLVSVQMQLDKGLDTKSAAAIYMMDSMKYGSDAFVAIFPATDAKELLANFTPQTEEEGVTPCDINGETFYARAGGKFVTLTKSHEIAKALGDVKSTMDSTLSASRKKLLSERVLSICVPVGKLTELYKDQIVGMFSMMQAMGGNAPSSQSASQGEGEAMVAQFKQMEWMDVHLGLDMAGLALTFVVTPVKGSEMEAISKKTKGMDGLLKGLPGDSFALAAGFAAPQDEKAYAQADQMIHRLVDSPVFAEKPELKATAMRVYEKVKSMAKSVHRGALCVSPIAEGGDGMFGLSAVVDTDDPAKLLEGIGEIKDEAMKAAKGEEDAEKALKMIELKKGAEEVDSIKVDHFILDPSKAEQMEEEELAHIKKVVGSDGIVIRMAAADSKHVVLGLGGGKTHYATAMKAAKSGATGVSSEKGLAEMSKSLPKNRTAEVYLDVDTTARLVKRMIVAAGEQDPIAQVPDIGAPVAFVGSIDGAVVRSDLVVPMEVIRGVRAMVMSSMQAMQGGGPDGAGGGEEDDDGDDAKPGKPEGGDSSGEKKEKP